MMPDLRSTEPDRRMTVDKLLDAYRVPAPSPALHRLIVASAPAAQYAWNSARVWWSGLGFAGVGLAGAAAGALAIATVASPILHAPASGWAIDEPTAFGDLGIEQDG